MKKKLVQVKKKKKVPSSLRSVTHSPLLDLDGEVGHNEEGHEAQEDELGAQGLHVLRVHPPLDRPGGPLFGGHQPPLVRVGGAAGVALDSLQCPQV